MIKKYIKIGVYKLIMKDNIGKILDKNVLFKFLLNLMVGVWNCKFVKVNWNLI